MLENAVRRVVKMADNAKVDPDLEEFRKKCRWITGYDPETETVTILPVNGYGSITLHGEKEARFFTDLLMDYFRMPKGAER